MQFQITLQNGTKEVGSGEIFVLTLDNGRRLQIRENESGTLEVMARDGDHFYIVPKTANVIEVVTTS